MSRLTTILKSAIQVAKKSDHHRHHHGAVLVKGSNIISSSANQMRFNRFTTRFLSRDQQLSWTTLHAEIGCILGINRETLGKSDLYVIRVNSAGALAMSKPCEVCMAIIEHVGIKRVFYSNEEGEIERYG